MKLEIKNATVDDVVNAPGFLQLAKEYSDECKTDCVPDEFNLNITLYKQLHDMGILHIRTIVDGSKLVGFAAGGIHELPKYSTLAMSVEILFISKPYRRGSTIARDLLAEFETIARDNNAISFILPAPLNGSLDRIAERGLGMTKITRSLYKKVVIMGVIDGMLPAEINKVNYIEEQLKTLPQLQDLATDHVLHAGIYSRSVVLKAGSLITGVLIKIPTTLVISGKMQILIGDDTYNVDGFTSLAAGANRKQVMYAIDDTYVTMSFQTEAKTIEQAEDEFTDFSNTLMSRCEGSINHITIGEV